MCTEKIGVIVFVFNRGGINATVQWLQTTEARSNPSHAHWDFFQYDPSNFNLFSTLKLLSFEGIDTVLENQHLGSPLRSIF